MAESRTPVGLWRAEATTRPLGLPVRRARGAKAWGVRYERALARAIPAARHGQWWRYQDQLGTWHCQTDLVLDLDSAMAVIEAKYTWTIVGHEQLDKLYLPVVGIATGKRTVGLVACRNLLPETARMCRVTGQLDEALALALSGARVVLHWLGKTGLDVGPGPCWGDRPTSYAPIAVAHRAGGR